MTHSRWSVKRLSNSHTHNKSAEGVEWPFLKIDVFLHISHQLSADGESATLENNDKEHGVIAPLFLSLQSRLPHKMFEY